MSDHTIEDRPDWEPPGTVRERRLRAINAELLAALKALCADVERWDAERLIFGQDAAALDAAKAIIAKAEQAIAKARGEAA